MTKAHHRALPTMATHRVTWVKWAKGQCPPLGEPCGVNGNSVRPQPRAWCCTPAPLCSCILWVYPEAQAWIPEQVWCVGHTPSFQVSFRHKDGTKGLEPWNSPSLGLWVVVWRASWALEKLMWGFSWGTPSGFQKFLWWNVCGECCVLYIGRWEAWASLNGDSSVFWLLAPEEMWATQIPSHWILIATLWGQQYK